MTGLFDDKRECLVFLKGREYHMISSFRRVLYVVCFVLGNSHASGVYMLQTPGNYQKENIEYHMISNGYST